MARDKFSPRRSGQYINGLAQEIAQAVRSGFRLSDDLRVQTEPTGLRLVGVIGCEGDIRVEIEEELRVRRSWFGGGGRPRFQLTFYRYNAVLLNRGTIFRYNSPHADHRSFHHVHRRDVLGTGEETVTRLEPADVPSIREVLKEAEDWYWTNLAGK